MTKIRHFLLKIEKIENFYFYFKMIKISEILDEAKHLSSLAWPVSFGYALQMSLSLAAVFSLGHGKEKETKELKLN